MKLPNRLRQHAGNARSNSGRQCDRYAGTGAAAGGTISAGGAPFSGSGTIAAPGLAPQASSSALQVNLNTGTAGIFTGTANLALASHDADLADLPLTTGPLSLNAQVNRFAALGFLKEGGDGALSDSFVLDFGNVLPGSSQEAMLAMLNDIPPAEQLFTDLLSTNGDGSIGPFRLSGCSVKDLPGGMSQPGCDVFFDTSVLGMSATCFPFRSRAVIPAVTTKSSAMSR
jgi:hypothetical protein